VTAIPSGLLWLSCLAREAFTEIGAKLLPLPETASSLVVRTFSVLTQVDSFFGWMTGPFASSPPLQAKRIPHIIKIPA
jgi:hypothetical protein